MKTETNEVAIYARVSSQEQALEGVSIEAQLALLRSYAQSQGWLVTGEYVDAGYSGGTDDRPNLRRLIADSVRGQFNIIAVSKLDRFFRNLRLMLNYLHDLEGLGIKFVASQEGLDTSTPYGKFAVQIMGVIAEFERGRIGERVRDSRQYHIAQKQWPGGQTLYGYRWLAKEHRWEVVPEEAKLVSYIYDLYVNKKLGILPIALQLNQEGHHPRSGGNWCFGTVHGILTHPGYKGQHPMGVAIPAIIAEETWQLAQEKRTNARTVRSEAKGWMLQGMVVCGKCGHMLQCIQKKGDKARYYVCRGRQVKNHLDGSERCDMRWVRAQEFERTVWKKVKEVLNDPDKLTQHVNKALSELEERRTKVGSEALAIEKTLSNVRAKQERLGIAFTDGALTEQIYKTKLSQLKKQEDITLKCRRNIDPTTMTELTELDERITSAKAILSKGRLVVSDYGLFGISDDKYVPVGYNVSRETDGTLSIGKATELDVVDKWGTGEFSKGIDLPMPSLLGKTKKTSDAFKNNLRSIMQLFSIKVYVYQDRAEIRGAIPQQVISLPEQSRSGASIISTARGLRG